MTHLKRLLKAKSPKVHLNEDIPIPQLTCTPRHIAIIMDGNGRWAQKHNQKRLQGHQAGVESIVKVVNLASKMGIEVISLFAFSSENWRRPKEEVQGLMQLFSRALKKELKQLEQHNVLLRFVGDRSHFSKSLQTQIQKAEEESKHNTGLKLIVATDYGGRWDIVQAARQIAKDAMDHKIQLDQIDEALFGQYIALADLPEPDLLIRTSGELRISNFFLWQLAYTELYFTDTFWPDFDEQAFLDALLSYERRNRRFGDINQLRAKKHV